MPLKQAIFFNVRALLTDCNKHIATRHDGSLMQSESVIQQAIVTWVETREVPLALGSIPCFTPQLQTDGHLSRGNDISSLDYVSVN